jgi:hypothetical protein
METDAPFIRSVEVADPAECGEAGLAQVKYDDAGPVSLTRGFLAAPEPFLSLLID